MDYISKPPAFSWDGGSDDRRKRQPRPFLGIHFECCNVYGRIYRNAGGTAYIGACPTCGNTVRVPIGDKGCNSRFFSAR